MTLLITRPEEDAKAVMALLADRGIAALAAPMMTIDYLSGPALDLTSVQGLIATSANGVRALARRCPDKTLPLYAVGDATMQKAVSMGFENSLSAAGDVQSLARLIIQKADPKAGAFLHAAGETLAGDLGSILAEAGFDYRRETLYRALEVMSFSDDVLAAFKAGEISGVLLYSPRTAKIFCNRLVAQGLVDGARRLDYYCLSPAVHDAIKQGLGDRAGHCHVADHPDQASLLALI